MLATFVIGLREGLEASLIVGIIATFLHKQGRQDAIRQVWVGVGIAVTICLAVGIGLKLASQDLPQRQQEGLETVVGAAAVAMVTYMVVWMRRHSRDLKRQLEGAATSALLSGSARALVLMAFIAVMREGLETAVFLLAAFNSSTNSTTAVAGAVLGIAVAVGLGVGIYRGGVRLNLSKFFRATGLVLVLVAAGLVVSALHTAHEAGWLQIGQGGTVNLSWLARPGTIRSSLLTGVLGVQPQPTVIEVAGWLCYLVPVAVYVAWPPGRRVASRSLTIGLAGLSLATMLSAGVLALLAPAAAPRRAGAQPVTVTTTSTLLPGGARQSVERIPAPPAGARSDGTTVRLGLTLRSLSSTAADPTLTVPTGALPASLDAAQLERIGGGRLPIGVSPTTPATRIPATYVATVRTTWQVDPSTRDVVAVDRSATWTAVAHTSTGAFPAGSVLTETATTTPATVAAAAAAVRHARVADHRHQLLGRELPIELAVAALVMAALAGSSGRALSVRARQGAAYPSPPRSANRLAASHR